MTKYITEEILDKDTVDFSNFVLPENEDVFLAGGAFKNLLRVNADGDLIAPSLQKLFKFYNKDFDIFAQSKEALDGVKEYFEVESPEYELSDMPSSGGGVLTNSIVYARNTTYSTFYLDLVHKYFGTPEEIMDQFDFTVTQCAMYKKNGKTYLVYSDRFKYDLANRILNYASTPNRSEDIMERLIRYMNYGFAPTEDTLNRGLRAIMDSSEILKNVAVADVLKPEFLKQVKAISEISVLLNRNRYNF